MLPVLLSTTSTRHHSGQNINNNNVKENVFFPERELIKALRNTLTRAALFGVLLACSLTRPFLRSSPTTDSLEPRDHEVREHIPHSWASSMIIFFNLILARGQTARLF